jgi:hypothetical protein
MPHAPHVAHMGASPDSFALPLVSARTFASLMQRCERGQACLRRSANLLRSADTALDEAHHRLTRMPAWTPSWDV